MQKINVGNIFARTNEPRYDTARRLQIVWKYTWMRLSLVRQKLHANVQHSCLLVLLPLKLSAAINYNINFAAALQDRRTFVVSFEPLVFPFFFCFGFIDIRTCLLDISLLLLSYSFYFCQIERDSIRVPQRTIAKDS